MVNTIMRLRASSRKVAYVHRVSNPFPVNPGFHGQEFVVSTLTSNTRHTSDDTTNVVLANGRKVMSNGAFDKQKRLARERFNTHLLPDYSSDCVGRATTLFKTISDLVQDGHDVVCDFHYPYMDIKAISHLHDLLVRAQIREMVRLIGHQHMMPNYCLFTGDHPTEEIIRKIIRNLAKLTVLLDGIVAVSDAVKDSYVTFVARDAEAVREAQFDKIKVIKNGSDLGIYLPATDSAKQEMRRELRLADGLKKVVCFVGRLEALKGSDILLKVLQYFNESRTRGSNIGFVIATSDVLNPEEGHRKEIFQELMKLERLISQGRLRVVLDISKFTRGDDRFRQDVIDILHKATSEGFRQLRSSDIYGGMVNFPVQAAADINLVPSVSEALSLATVEGALAGCYAIAHNTGGLIEVLIDTKLGTLINTSGDLDSVGRAFVDEIILAAWSSRTRNRRNLTLDPSYFETYSGLEMSRRFEGYAGSLFGCGST